MSTLPKAPHFSTIHCPHTFQVVPCLFFLVRGIPTLNWKQFIFFSFHYPYISALLAPASFLFLVTPSQYILGLGGNEGKNLALISQRKEILKLPETWYYQNHMDSALWTMKHVVWVFCCCCCCCIPHHKNSPLCSSNVCLLEYLIHIFPRPFSSWLLQHLPKWVLLQFLPLLIHLIYFKVFLSKNFFNVSCSILFNVLRPQGLKATMLLYPWNSPSRNTEVSDYSLL